MFLGETASLTGSQIVTRYRSLDTKKLIAVRSRDQGHRGRLSLSTTLCRCLRRCLRILGNMMSWYAPDVAARMAHWSAAKELARNVSMTLWVILPSLWISRPRKGGEDEVIGILSVLSSRLPSVGHQASPFISFHGSIAVRNNALSLLLFWVFEPARPVYTAGRRVY
jgi:hypothetical protein